MGPLYFEKDSMQRDFFAARLTEAINAYLALDPEATQRMTVLADHIIRIEIKELPFSITLLFTSTRVEVLSHYCGEVQTCIRGPALALIRQGLPSSKTQLSDIEISGNIEVGLAVNHFLKSIEIDWEEHVSQVIGDVAAHQLCELSKKISSWILFSTRSLQENVGEYLKEEAQWCVNQIEVNDFLNDVDLLRNDIERLQVRISNLKRVEKYD